MKGAGGQERSPGDLFSIGRQSRIPNRSPTQDALIGSVVHCGTTEASSGFSILEKSQTMYITHLSGRGLGGMTQWTCYPLNGNRRKNNGRNGLNPRPKAIIAKT